MEISIFREARIVQPCESELRPSPNRAASPNRLHARDSQEVHGLNDTSRRDFILDA